MKAKEMSVREGFAAFFDLNEKYFDDDHDRTDLSDEKHREYLGKAFDLYEACGFEETLPDDIAGLYEEDAKHIGMKFRVVSRCEEGERWDLESLPAWNIEFEDGHRMEVYPEDISLLERASIEEVI